MTHPIIAGSIMGAAIGGLDMALRPRFANGFMELFLFALEGAGAYIVYKILYHPNWAGFGCSTGDDTTTTKSLGLDGNLIQKSLIGGLTIWLTDLLLKPANINGMGSEYIKFLIQGIIVFYVFGMS